MNSFAHIYYFTWF